MQTKAAALLGIDQPTVSALAWPPGEVLDRAAVRFHAGTRRDVDIQIMENMASAPGRLMVKV